MLERAEEKEKKLCVMTGPVFRNDDVVYSGEKIPADFWKIVVLRRGSDNKVAACAFMISQKEYLDHLAKKDKASEFINANLNASANPEKVDTSHIAVYQVPIETIEKLTNLNFGSLKEVDAYSLYDERKAATMSAGVPITLTEGGDLEVAPAAERRKLIQSGNDIVI
jgi:endonuclease G, mitochondrial